MPTYAAAFELRLRALQARAILGAMAGVQESVVINRPIAAVFAYLADMRNVARWMAEDFASVELDGSNPSQNATGDVARYVYTTREGRRGTWTWHEFVPPRRLAWEGPPLAVGFLGAVQGRGFYRLEDHNQETEVTVGIEPLFSGLTQFMAPMVRLGMSRRLGTQVRCLKELVEATTPASSL